MVRARWGVQAPGLAPDDHGGGLRVGHGRVHLRPRPAARHRAVHRRAPRRRPASRRRADAGRRPAVRRAARHAAPALAVRGDVHARVEHVSALRVPGVRVLVVAFLGIGSVFGGMQVSLAAFTESIGEPGLNGVLYGDVRRGQHALRHRLRRRRLEGRAPRRRLLVGYAALALTASGLWAAHSVLAARRRSACWSGMCIAPALITGYTLVEKLVPAGRPHRGLHLADRRGRARPGGGRHGRRPAGGPPLGRRRVPGADGRHGARAWLTCWRCAHGCVTAADGRTVATWRRSPSAGDSGLIPQEYVTMDRR